MDTRYVSDCRNGAVGTIVLVVDDSVGRVVGDAIGLVVGDTVGLRDGDVIGLTVGDVVRLIDDDSDELANVGVDSVKPPGSVGGHVVFDAV